MIEFLQAADLLTNLVDKAHKFINSPSSKSEQRLELLTLVSSLISQFEEACENVLLLYAERWENAGIYGTPFPLQMNKALQAKIINANRKLYSIYQEMKSIYGGLESRCLIDQKNIQLERIHQYVHLLLLVKVNYFMSPKKKNTKNNIS